MSQIGHEQAPAENAIYTAANQENILKQKAIELAKIQKELEELLAAGKIAALDNPYLW